MGWFVCIGSFVDPTSQKMQAALVLGSFDSPRSNNWMHALLPQKSFLRKFLPFNTCPSIVKCGALFPKSTQKREILNRIAYWKLLVFFNKLYFWFYQLEFSIKCFQFLVDSWTGQATTTVLFLLTAFSDMLRTKNWSIFSKQILGPN